MDIYPLDCPCFSIVANVVFIYLFLNRAEKNHYLSAFVKWIYGWEFWNPQIAPVDADFFICENLCNLRINKSLSDLRAMLDWFHKS